MTRRKVGTRRRIALTVGTTVALILGGAVVAPFASASDRPGGQSGDRRSGPLGRWLSFWGGGGSASGSASGSQASADGCSDVELVFARGTGDFPRPLGILGVPLSAALKRELPGRSVTATGVDYAADFAQTSDGPGATVMSRHIAEVADRCEDTQFVIGGYSQGASVTDIAIAARGSRALGRGETIPTDLAPRIAAVVVFGNPLSGFGGTTLENASDLYGDRTRSFCGNADTICGGARNGNVQGGHLSYASNGAVDDAAEFAAGHID
jgi:cutinase